MNAFEKTAREIVRAWAQEQLSSTQASNIPTAALTALITTALQAEFERGKTERCSCSGSQTGQTILCNVCKFRAQEIPWPSEDEIRSCLHEQGDYVNNTVAIYRECISWLRERMAK